MKQNNNEVLESDAPLVLFFSNVLNIVNNYGAKVGMKLLNSSIEQIESLNLHFPTDKAKEILNVVAEELNLDPNQLIVKGVHGHAQDAKQIFYCLLKVHLNLSNRRIADHLKINHALISLATQRLHKSNPKIKMDKDFLDYYERCNNRLLKLNENK